MKACFTVPLPPPGLRRNSETRATGWRAKLVRDYQEQVWCAAAWEETVGMPWGRARVTLVWRAAGVLPDEDNALASCKWLVDVLKATGPRPLGIVVDDSPEHLEQRIRVEKCKRRADECVIVEVERL